MSWLWFIILTYTLIYLFIYLTHISIPLCNAGLECLCGDLWNFLLFYVVNFYFYSRLLYSFSGYRKCYDPRTEIICKSSVGKQTPLQARLSLMTSELWWGSTWTQWSGQDSRHILIRFITPLARHFYWVCVCSNWHQNCVYTHQEKIKQVGGIIFFAKIKKSLSVKVYPFQTSSKAQWMNPLSRSRNWPFIAVLRIHWVENSRGGGDALVLEDVRPLNKQKQFV